MWNNLEEVSWENFRAYLIGKEYTKRSNCMHKEYYNSKDEIIALERHGLVSTDYLILKNNNDSKPVSQ